MNVSREPDCQRSKRPAPTYRTVNRGVLLSCNSPINIVDAHRIASRLLCSLWCDLALVTLHIMDSGLSK